MTKAGAELTCNVVGEEQNSNGSQTWVEATFYRWGQRRRFKVDPLRSGLKEDWEFTLYWLEERNTSAWGKSDEGRDSASNRTPKRLVKNYCWSYH